MDAAAEVFGGEDYARASTADIASRAGVSKSQLFFYFHNKRELYLYVLGALTRRVAETVVDERWYEIDDFFEVMRYAATRLPLRDGSFDVAWCNDSFHHYPDPELRHILGTWFSDVSWRRVGQTACVAVARKGA